MHVICLVKPGDIKQVTLTKPTTLSDIAKDNAKDNDKIVWRRQGKRKITLFQPVTLPLLLEHGDIVSILPKNFN